MKTNYDYYKACLEGFMFKGDTTLADVLNELRLENVAYADINWIKDFRDFFKWLGQNHIEKISYQKINKECVYLGTMLHIMKNCEDTDKPYLYFNVKWTENGKQYCYALRNEDKSTIATYNDCSCRELLPFLKIGAEVNREEILKYVEFD